MPHLGRVDNHEHPPEALFPCCVCEHLSRPSSAVTANDMTVSPRLFSCLDLSVFLWALANVGHLTPNIMQLFISCIGQPSVIEKMTAHDIANVVWVYATVGVKADWLLEVLATQLLGPEVLTECTEDEASQILWAYTVLGWVVCSCMMLVYCVAG